MRPASDTLRQLIRQSHARRYEVTVTVPNVGDVVLESVVDGNVSFDLSRTTGARAGALAVVGDDAIPNADDHPLAPFGQYASVAFIYDLPTGPERIDVGQFPIIGVTTRRPEKRVDVVLGDWAYRVDRALLEAAEDWLPTETVDDVIAQLLADALGYPVTLTSDLGNETIGGDGFVGNAGESRWALIYNLADAHDRYVYFTDRTNVTIVQRTGIGAAVEELNTDQDDAVVVTSTSDISQTTAYNRIIVNVEASGVDAPAYRAVRTLTTGPLAYDPDGFGKYPLYVTYRVENATQALADGYADQLFARQAGAARAFDLDVIPMPYLEAGDTVMLTTNTGSELAVIESLSFPFPAERAGTLSTRTERTQSPTLARGSSIPRTLGAG